MSTIVTAGMSIMGDSLKFAAYGWHDNGQSDLLVELSAPVYITTCSAESVVATLIRSMSSDAAGERRIASLAIETGFDAGMAYRFVDMDLGCRTILVKFSRIRPSTHKPAVGTSRPLYMADLEMIDFLLGESPKHPHDQELRALAYVAAHVK